MVDVKVVEQFTSLVKDDKLTRYHVHVVHTPFHPVAVVAGLVVVALIRRVKAVHVKHRDEISLQSCGDPSRDRGE